ncbi:hypothetical protein BDW75DRAFT_13320 [Aspergillus navahoensis]
MRLKGRPRILSSLIPLNLTRLPSVRSQLLPPPTPATTKVVLKSAPFIPFLSSFFSSSAQVESQKQNRDMAPPPDNRSEDEWRAVLSPG